MPAVEINFKGKKRRLYQGSSWEKIVTVEDEDGNAWPLAGWTLQGQLRDRPAEDAGSDILASFVFTVYDTNVFGFGIHDAAISEGIDSGVYYYDIQYISDGTPTGYAAGWNEPGPYGIIEFYKDVTRV